MTDETVWLTCAVEVGSAPVMAKGRTTYVRISEWEVVGPVFGPARLTIFVCYKALFRRKRTLQEEFLADAQPRTPEEEIQYLREELKRARIALADKLHPG